MKYFISMVAGLVLICSAMPTSAIEFFVDPSEELGYAIGGFNFLPQTNMTDVFYKDSARAQIAYGTTKYQGLKYTLIHNREDYGMVLFDLFGLDVQVNGEGYIAENAAADAVGSFGLMDIILRPKVILFHIPDTNTTIGFNMGLRLHNTMGRGFPGWVFGFDPTLTVAQHLIDALSVQSDVGVEISTDTNDRSHFVVWNTGLSFDFNQTAWTSQFPLALNLAFLLRKDIDTTSNPGSYDLELGVYWTKFERLQVGMNGVVGLTGNSNPDYYIGSVLGYHF